MFSFLKFDNKIKSTVPVFRLPSCTARSKINCDVQATGGTGVDDGPVFCGTHWVTLHGTVTGRRTGTGSLTLNIYTATIKMT
jgi:hypothetical protein